MANYQPNEDYTGETKLRNWWPIVKSNFADVYSKLNGHFNGTSDRHKGTDVDYSTQMTVTAAIDKEISDRKSADTTEKNERTAADTAEQNARIAADNAEQEARMGADNAEQTARQEADTEIKNEMNNVFTESGIVEEATETSTLYIPGGAELGFTMLNADGEPAKDFIEAKEIYPWNPNESAQAAIKINGTPITIGDYDTGAYDDLDYWETPYGYVLLCYYGTITNENVYTLTKVSAEIAGGTRKSVIDRENGTFELVLAYAQDTIWSEEAQSNIFTREIYERNTDNEVDSVYTVIHEVVDKETVDTLQNSVEQNTTDIENISNNTTLIKNINGGFAAGDNAWTAYGGAIGRGTHTSHGGAIGDTAYSSLGGAIGESSKAGNGFSGGKEAIVAGDSESGYIDAIQLGTGTNNNANTLQVYSYQLLDANGKIPSERLPESSGGNSKKYATVVVGASSAGYTASQVDYLCTGTNDQTVINQAIQSLTRGGKVILLEGVYYVSGQILVNKYNVTIEGMGIGATFIDVSSAPFGVFSVTNYGAVIKDLTISNGESGNGGIGIYINGTSASDCKVDNCYVSDFNYGINITNAGKYHRIVDVKAENNTVGIHINNAYCEVVNNRCINSSERGINIEGSNNLITGNMVVRDMGYETGMYSICLSMNPSNNFITGNYIPGKDVTQAGSNNTVTNNKYE